MTRIFKVVDITYYNSQDGAEKEGNGYMTDVLGSDGWNYDGDLLGVVASTGDGEELCNAYGDDLGYCLGDVVED